MANLTNSVSELQAVVSVNETVKNVLFSAFQLNLLGFNARVLANRLGTQALGFGVLSREWVTLGEQLRVRMTELGGVSHKLVSTFSEQRVFERRHRLLQEARARSSQRSEFWRACTPRLEQQSSQRQASVSKAHAKMAELVREAGRSCMYGVVIARSARIEAAWAGTGTRLLTQLAQEFEERLAEVMPVLTQLRKLSQRRRG